MAVKRGTKGPTPRARTARMARLSKDLEKASTIEDAVLRRESARSVARMIVLQDHWLSLELQGRLSSEQGRGLAGMESNIQRGLQRLGATKKAKKSAGFLS